jgi:hypothetical protein
MKKGESEYRVSERPGAHYQYTFHAIHLKGVESVFAAG